MNNNDRIDLDMNETLQNGDVSSGIGLLKSQTTLQYEKFVKLNKMNMSVDNDNYNGGHFYMNSSTGYEPKNQNSIDYTKIRDEISTNIYLRENNGLPDGVDIGDMLPASAPNHYVNI